MSAIEALLIFRVRATPTGLPYQTIPRAVPVLATGRPGITAKGVRSVLIATGGSGTAQGSGTAGTAAGAGGSGDATSARHDALTATGGPGRSRV